jgi:hypothetical protein
VERKPADFAGAISANQPGLYSSLQLRTAMLLQPTRAHHG